MGNAERTFAFIFEVKRLFFAWGDIIMAVQKMALGGDENCGDSGQKRFGTTDIDGDKASMYIREGIGQPPR